MPDPVPPMADPLEALRLPLMPISPDPGFARRLRARLAVAAAPTRGATMTTFLTQDDHPTATTTAASGSTAGAERGGPVHAGAAIPYLAVPDGRGHEAIDWYVVVLGGRLVGEPIVMDDGRIGHAELAFAHGLLYLAEAFPEIGVTAPVADQAPVSLVLAVPDVDAAIAAAVDGGANLTRPVYEGYGHRGGTIVDPFGHRWLLQTPLPDDSPDDTHPESAPAEVIRPGDLAYVSLWVPEADRAADFFGEVLGWSVGAAAGAGHARQVEGLTLPHGIHGGHQRPTLYLCFATDDLDAAVTRIRASGGTAEDPVTEAFGTVVACTDPDGTPFSLFLLGSDGADPQADPQAVRSVNGEHAGDLSYITHWVIDSARFRAFYGAVLGWSFSPGRVDDGWGADDVAPMSGLQGGHPQPTVVPMYQVDDIEAAVAAVRRLGGTSTDPEAQPYGISAECTDDQGTSFYLGQL